MSDNSDTSSVILSLETLKAEYDTILLQYNKTQADYITYINQQASNPSKKDPLVSIKGQAFWGTGAATNSENNNISTVDECSALCSATANCTGATFNNTDHGRNICFLRSGVGTPIPALEKDYAIIPESQKYLNMLKNLNIRLTDINNQILNTINTADPLYTEQVNERKQKIILLNKNYNTLLGERDKINKKLDEFNDLEEVNNTSNILIYKNYYSYMLFIVIIIVAVIILIKIGVKTGINGVNGIQRGGKLNNNTYYIVFGIFLLSLVAYFFKKKN